MAFYVLDENHNLIEAYDKEGVLAVLAQAIKDGSLDGITADSAFISKLKCCVTGGTNRVAFVTQHQYNSLKKRGGLQSNCLYIITDDNTYDGLDTALSEAVQKIEGFETGDIVVGTAHTLKVAGLSGITYQGKMAIVPISKAGLYAVTVEIPSYSDSLNFSGGYVKETVLVYVDDINNTLCRTVRQTGSKCLETFIVNKAIRIINRDLLDNGTQYDIEVLAVKLIYEVEQ